MKEFAALFEQIDQTQSTNEKVEYIQHYFTTCQPGDGAWALFFLCGYRLKRLISSRMLLKWCQKRLQLPTWLVEESYAAVGDTAETISLLFPRIEAAMSTISLSEWMEKIVSLQKMSLQQQEEQILQFWEAFNSKEMFVFNKILTGSFRVGVSLLLTLKALSQAIGVAKETLSHRLMGNWQPTAQFFASLRLEEAEHTFLNPYPFCLAYPLENIENLGEVQDWLIEWKWDGIRAQIIKKQNSCAIWSRGNELISTQFPELVSLFEELPDGIVLDGEIIAYENNRPLPFGALQKRLGRKLVSKKLIETVPVVFILYDILEYAHIDRRAQPLQERRLLFEKIPLHSPKFLFSKEVVCASWQEVKNLRLKARELATEGLMLKKKTSAYSVGRQKGIWWKYKVDPFSLDMILMYAQAGSGRRANLFTDYTFGVWHDQQLIPIAKAYSGLTQLEINQLDRWIRANTEEKFGPVRKVKPQQVFEIAFEGIQLSNRHKSGVALRFPRILRWRKDKPIEECDTLTMIKDTYFYEEK